MLGQGRPGLPEEEVAAPVFGVKGIPLTEAVRSRVNYHPITTGELWNASVSANVAGEDGVHDLGFEDLLADPDGAVREVCDPVGVPFEAGMLAVPRSFPQAVRMFPGRQGEGGDAGGTGSWHRGGLGPTEVLPRQKIAGGLIGSHDYAPPSRSPRRPSGSFGASSRFR